MNLVEVFILIVLFLEVRKAALFLCSFMSPDIPQTNTVLFIFFISAARYWYSGTLLCFPSPNEQFYLLQSEQVLQPQHIRIYSEFPRCGDWYFCLFRRGFLPGGLLRAAVMWRVQSDAITL